MIDIQALSHRYPRATSPALQHIDLHIAQGECWGLLGHNGAGKTTLMALMAGLQEVQQGAILLNGVPMAQLKRPIRQKIGLVPQDFAFYPQLSVWDNMLFFAALYQERQKTWLENLLDKAGLLPHRHKAAKHLSGGLKRRLNFAIGLINRPEWVFLDEITVGIDPQSRRFILDSVAELTQQGVTVVYTSHYLQEIEQLCGKIALLDQGKLVYQGDLTALLHTQTPTVRFSTSAPLPPELCTQWQLQQDAHGIYETTAHAQQAAQLYQHLQQNGISLPYFQQGHGSLESFYLDFLRRHAAQHEDTPT